MYEDLIYRQNPYCIITRYRGKPLATSLLIAECREASLRDAEKLEGVDIRIQMQTNIPPRKSV